VAVCPKLTELTVICSQPDTAEAAETGSLLDPVGTVRSSTSELVNACGAPPEFDTLQIVYVCGPMYKELYLSERRRRQALREHAGCARDSAINCSKELETGCQEREGRRKTTVRVIELVAGSSYVSFHPDCVRVEEREV
jgi:hypothetical protein